MFGKVPLAALLGNKYASGSVALEGTFAGRSQTFTYVAGLEDNTPSNATVAAKANDCRAIHFDFVGGNRAGEPYSPGDKATLRLTQESSDPVSAGVTPEALGTLDAALRVGQSWSITWLDESRETNMSGFLNGYAICASRTPLDVVGTSPG